MDWFIFGAGFSGRETGRQLATSGLRVAGTTRSIAKFPALEGIGISPLIFEGSGIGEAIAGRLSTVTHLLMSIGPDDGGDPLVPGLSQALASATPSLQWIGYLSTVGVYGDHDGAWVDEETACRPVSQRSVERLEAEAAWQDFASQQAVPLAILRLSGIYGKGRNGFVNLAKGTAKRVLKKGQVFNRIHVEDIGGAVRHLAQLGLGGLFNVTDDEPAPPQDVVTFAANLMGVAPPPEIWYDEASMSEMARSFYGEVKRVSNAKLKATGYQFRHPDYREAFTAMWAGDKWR